MALPGAGLDSDEAGSGARAGIEIGDGDTGGRSGGACG